MNYAVLIPTFRRPASLARLLESLVPEIGDQAVQVIVADNDCGTEVPEVAQRFEGLLDLDVIQVKKPGVSHVRNALITRALELDSDVQWLIMVDDDSYVLPGWWPQHVDTGKRLGAALVGGRCMGELPPDAPRLVRNSILAGISRGTGIVDELFTGQNLAISRPVIDALTPTWFDPSFGRTGGEDFDFIQRAAAQGFTLAWCDAAAIAEPVPAERQTARYLLKRFHGDGINATRAQLGLQSAHHVRQQFAADVGQWWLRVAKALVLRDPDRLAERLINAAHLTGRARGLMGNPQKSADRYGEGSSVAAACHGSAPARNAADRGLGTPVTRLALDHPALSTGTTGGQPCHEALPSTATVTDATKAPTPLTYG